MAVCCQHFSIIYLFTHIFIFYLVQTSCLVRPMCLLEVLLLLLHEGKKRVYLLQITGAGLRFYVNIQIHMYSSFRSYCSEKSAFFAMAAKKSCKGRPGYWATQNHHSALTSCKGRPGYWATQNHHSALTSCKGRPGYWATQNHHSALTRKHTARSVDCNWRNSLAKVTQISPRIIMIYVGSKKSATGSIYFTPREVSTVQIIKLTFSQQYQLHKASEHKNKQNVEAWNLQLVWCI